MHALRAQLDAVSRGMREMADELSEHAHEQELASTADAPTIPTSMGSLRSLLGQDGSPKYAEDLLRHLFGASGGSTEDSLGGFEDPRHVSSRTIGVDLETIQAFDPRTTVQGDSFGDCWFLATLASVAAQNPELIAENIELVHGPTPDEDYWIVTLYENGEPVEHVVTQDELVKDGVRGRIDHDTGSYSERISWMSIYERAAVEHVGGDYGDLEANFAGKGFDMITGDSGSLSINAGFDSIRADLEDGKSVVTSTPPGWLLGGAPDGDVVDGHVYIVEGLSTNQEGEEVIVLVNPWGTPQPPASKPPVLELTQEEYAANFVSRNTVAHDS
ncbi:C2 family cysteine protease [Brachybacterium sp. AOP29-B2-41]|uniref:C2 family cysteine protease n=1 Tax=Brachybacterium sp. AOP29-B2-41 TaxID=3457704 RepID=UPI004034B2CF